MWVCRNVMFTTLIFDGLFIPPIKMVMVMGDGLWHCYTNMSDFVESMYQPQEARTRRQRSWIQRCSPGARRWPDVNIHHYVWPKGPGVQKTWPVYAVWHMKSRASLNCWSALFDGWQVRLCVCSFWQGCACLENEWKDTFAQSLSSCVSRLLDWKKIENCSLNQSQLRPKNRTSSTSQTAFGFWVSEAVRFSVHRQTRSHVEPRKRVVFKTSWQSFDT